MATRTPKPTNSDLNLTTLSAKVPTSKLLAPYDVSSLQRLTVLTRYDNNVGDDFFGTVAISHFLF